MVCMPLIIFSIHENKKNSLQNRIFILYFLSNFSRIKEEKVMERADVMAQIAEYAPYQEELVCLHKKSTKSVTYPYHRHDGYEIFLFLQGTAQFYLEENCYELQRGDLMIMSPYNMHRIYTEYDTYYERITINVRKEVIDSMSTEQTNLFECFAVSDDSCVPPVVLSEEEILTFVALADELSDVMEKGGYGSDIRVRNLFSELLLCINDYFRQATETKKSIMPPLVRDIMIYVQENIDEELTLEQLSEIFYRNGPHLSRTFKKYTGLSLHAYIQEHRINYAKKLLRQGKSVSDACFMSGFRDYSNFIRNFTTKVGCSPGKWGKENRL